MKTPKINKAGFTAACRVAELLSKAMAWTTEKPQSAAVTVRYPETGGDPEMEVVAFWGALERSRVVIPQKEVLTLPATPGPIKELAEELVKRLTDLRSRSFVVDLGEKPK